MAMTVDQKRLKATKFPPEFDTKVDTQKVNIDLMKKWIAGKITEILGDEDDVVIDTTYNLLEETRVPNIKAIQIQLTGFLGKDCAAFCKELWSLMLSAQSSPLGVPKELLEAKKLEMKQEQASKAAAEFRRRDQAKEETDMINSFQHSDRPERPERPERGRGGFGGRPPRGDRLGRGRDFDRRGGPPRRDSRSPPPKRRRSPPPRRDRDTYVPRGRGRFRDRSRERRHSPPRSRSRTPPLFFRRRAASVSASASPPPRRKRSPTPQRHSRRSPSSSPSRSLSRYGKSRERHVGRLSRPRSTSRTSGRRRSHKLVSRSITPKERSSSPSPRRTMSISRSPLRRRRRSSSSHGRERSFTPKSARARRTRRSISRSSKASSDDPEADLRKSPKKRARSSSLACSRSPSRRARRKATRSPPSAD